MGQILKRSSMMMFIVVFTLLWGGAVYAEDEAFLLTTASEQWGVVSSKGFASQEEADKILNNYNDYSTLLLNLQKKYGSSGDQKWKSLLDSAAQNKSLFDGFLSKEQSALEKRIKNELKSKNMIAKRYDMVAQQALDSGSNVPQGMVGMYKRTISLDTVKKDITLYNSIAEVTGPDAQKMAKGFGEQLKYVEQVGVKLGAEDSAVTPRDSYAGKDKKVLKKMIEKAWKSQYPKDEVLGIRFVDESWIRKTEKRYNNTVGWYLEDFSSMEVKVVVKQDKFIAAIYPVFFIKDHTKGDAIDLDAETGKSNSFFKSEMLLKNYKP